MTADLDPDKLIVEATERYSFGWHHPHAYFGRFGDKREPPIIRYDIDEFLRHANESRNGREGPSDPVAPCSVCTKAGERR